MYLYIVETILSSVKILIKSVALNNEMGYELTPKKREAVFVPMLQLLPQSKRESAKKIINEIMDLYEGQDANAMGVLYRAAEKGCFEKYVKKLESYYEKEGKYVPVQFRHLARRQPLALLETILKQEEEIQAGKRPEKDRERWPKPLQNIHEHPESIKMELFFANCYKEIMK